ncbi:bile acid:sodium symporter family protein [Bremerella sp. JC770]|uniref:bile acid:sodium symporter family protein n=1 Tax=Bremerella sp. JC770 TaxID=3232137 RepID=UPI003457F3EC
MSMEVIIVGTLITFALLATRYVRSIAFTVWVLAGVGTAYCYPQAFQSWWGLSLASLIVPLIQLIMFGMGTTLSLADFQRIMKEPWPVLLGISLQYGVMPLTGYLLVVAFGFTGELAAGIILTGACSGGVASNLMSYIGKGNVALSVTMTAVSTMLAPVMTPLAMTFFAGQYIDVNALGMLIGVVNIIIAPVLAGMIAHAILYGQAAWLRRPGTLAFVSMGFLVIGVAATLVPVAQADQLRALTNSLGFSLILIGAMGIAKSILLLRGHSENAWLDRTLPVLSMIGVCAILIIITAQTHDVLVQVGGMLFVAAVIHNMIGLTLGYWGARGVGSLIGRIGYRLGVFDSSRSRLSESDCRTVAFEVGMQNGGMATGLAINVLKSHLAALPSNVFGTWMNISGSLLANYWSRDVSDYETSDDSIDTVAEPLSH